jgi:hypothetical protein
MYNPSSNINSNKLNIIPFVQITHSREEAKNFEEIVSWYFDGLLYILMDNV